MQRRLFFFAAFAIGAYLLGWLLLDRWSGPAPDLASSAPADVAEAPLDPAIAEDVDALWEFGIARLGWMPPPPEERCEATAEQLREWIQKDIEIRGLDDGLGYFELGYD